MLDTGRFVLFRAPVAPLINQDCPPTFVNTMPKHKISEMDLEFFRKTNIGLPLTEIARDFQRRVLVGFAAHGHIRLQPAQTSVLTHLSLSGTRLTDLAKRASMTKQAMGQLVDEVERLGYVERVADPTDSRAKMVCFTEKGRRLMCDAVEIGANVQVEYENLIGKQRLKDLRDILDDFNHKLRDLAQQDSGDTQESTRESANELTRKPTRVAAAVGGARPRKTK